MNSRCFAAVAGSASAMYMCGQTVCVRIFSKDPKKQGEGTLDSTEETGGTED